MANKQIKLKNVSVKMPKIIMGEKPKNDKHKKRQKESVRTTD